MRFGLITPVLTLLPRAHAGWETSGDFADVAEIARAADRFGYDHLTCSEHVAIPATEAPIRGGRYWDPAPTLGAVAALTERVRLATFVIVLGYHHPLALVKRYGTLDRISGGRVVLGVGVGSLADEFALLDARFDDRGARADDAIRAIRASWGRTEPVYHGSHFSFDGVTVDPAALHDSVPIWIGGRTPRSLRRAVVLGDAWAPFGLSPDDVARLIARARTTDAWARRDDRLEVWLQPAPLDPVGDAPATVAALHALAAAGATGTTVRFVHHSRSHLVEQMEAFAVIAEPIAGAET